MENKFNTIESVKEYYGKVLSTSKDLKTSACCSTEALPTYMRCIAKQIHQEVQEKFYGCGSPFPEGLSGRTVLDLGCGSGRDVYMLSKLVGESGRVIGLDMTPEQLAVAEKYQDYHREKFGYKKSNVQFLKGYIEDLKGAGIADNSVDLVVSNCVTNLSPDKPRLFREIWRVLKPGGELYFSDVFSDRRIPHPLTEDPVLVGECLGGALYTEDFRRLMSEIGCRDFRMMTKSKIELHNSEVEKKAGFINFYSITFRAFKLELEDKCEDFGQAAVYQGTLPHSPHSFLLDSDHEFKTGKITPICGNTAEMLSKTAYREYFKILGDGKTHYGIFNSGSTNSGAASTQNQSGVASGACC